MNGKILIVEDEFIIAEDLRKILERSGYEISGIAASVPKALEIISLKRPALVFVDIQLNGKLTGIDLAMQLNQMEIPFIYVSANSNQSILKIAKSTKPHGFLVKPFREKDVLVTLDIALYRYENNLESKLLKEISFQKDVLSVLENDQSWEDRFSSILESFESHILVDFFSINYFNSRDDRKDMAWVKNKSGNFDFMPTEKISQRTRKSLAEIQQSKTTNILPLQVTSYNENGFEEMINEHPFQKLIAREFELGSVLFLPIPLTDNESLLFSFYSVKCDFYTQEHIVIIERLKLVWAKIAERVAYRQIKAPLCQPVENYDEPPIIVSEKTEVPKDYGLVGASEVFVEIKKQLETISKFDISVLILGESGTGKERIAQSVHRLSHRKTMPLIKVNCAAIPASLMESELFGHEKGSFTGAVNRRVGKFEEAIGGTIFLDEIGELPLDLQVKLLCVLQEKEIVRVGGNQTIKTDVRIIAATNRNLEKEVAEGRFRLDLYYRLNVFPITLPPLRERKDDLDDLTCHFLSSLSKKMGKHVIGVSESVRQTLLEYDWPGNIRELENILERSILLARTNILEHVNIPDKIVLTPSNHHPEMPLKTFKEMEKDYIFSVLKRCNGKIGGPGGAAEILDLAPTTLISKMNKLGIVKKFTT